MLNEEKQLIYKMIQDPVTWGEYYLKSPTDPKEPLRLRPYQKEILRCRNKKKVLRMARRLGKTVTMCVEILWKATTFKNKEILLVAPYQAQVLKIFEFMETMIQDVSELQNACKVRRSPFFIIEFPGNHSTIRGFTAGSRSGQKGEGVRGQDATDIYFDEVDYMGSTAINAIKAIEISRPDVAICASSTPTGKREQFYHWCTNKSLGFTEFHYKAEVLPQWGPEVEKMFRSECTSQNQYIQEFEAGWGEEVHGVFPQDRIDDCLLDYHYLDWKDHTGRMHPGCIREISPENTYIMGIDWNGEGVGTRAVVLEYMQSSEDPSMRGKMRVFYHEDISETLKMRGVKTFNNIESVKRVLDLSMTYNCSFVYLDKGYGHTNYELLLKYGAERGFGSNPEDIFKEVDFNGKTRIFRPNGTREDKWTKEFMVGSAVKFMEQGSYVVPSFEDDRYALVGQMREYAVLREGATGRKKYTDENEDSLIAFLLATHGFVMEYSELTQYNSNVRQQGYSKGMREVPIRETTEDGDQGFKKVLPDTEERGPAFAKHAQKAGMPYNYTRDSRDRIDSEDHDPDYDTNARFRTMRNMGTIRRTMIGGRSGGSPSRRRF